MLLNSGPLNAAVLNSSGAAPAQNLAASAQGSATLNLAQAQQGFALTASVQGVASAPTARPGAAQPLGGTLAAAASVATSVLNRTSGALAALLAAGASADSSALAIAYVVGGQLSGSGTTAATLTWLVPVSGDPVAVSAAVLTANLFRGAGPLASALVASSTAASLFTVQSHSMTGAAAAVATVWPILQWGNPIAAQVSASAGVGAAALSLTNKTLAASIVGAAEATAPGFVMATAISGLLEVRALGSYAFLENTSRGRLSASNYGVAYVFADMPQHHRLSPERLRGVCLSGVSVGYAPFLAGSVSASLQVQDAGFVGGGVLRASVSASAAVTAAPLAEYALRASLYGGATDFNAFRAELRTPWQPLAATTSGTATAFPSDLRNPRCDLSAQLSAEAVFFPRGALADWSNIKQIGGQPFGTASVESAQLLPLPPVEYDPIKNLSAWMNAFAGASGTIIGGGYTFAGRVVAGALVGRADMPLPNYPLKDLSTIAQGRATFTRVEFRTSRQELAADISVYGSTTSADLDKWPDIRNLLARDAVALATIKVAYLHSPNAILIGEPSGSATVNRAGLGYVLDLEGAALSSAFSGAAPRFEKRLAGQGASQASASGYVVNLSVLQAFINNATAQIVALPSVDFSLSASAGSSSEVGPDLRLSKHLESAHLVLAAVNGQLSVLYRGVEIDGPTAATVEVSAGVPTADLFVDSIYADLEIESASYLKAA